MPELIEMSITGGLGDAILKATGFTELKLSDPTIRTVCHAVVHNDLALDYINNHPDIDEVVEHEFIYEENKELFFKLGERPDYLGEATVTTYFPEIPYIVTYEQPSSEKNLKIVLHLNGSNFSTEWITNQYNQRDKSYDIDFWFKYLASLDSKLAANFDIDKIELIVVGSEEDKTKTDISILANHFSLIDMRGKTDCQGLINIIMASDVTIGVDSSAKSISLAGKVPTIIFVRDYYDPIRDATFLTPYARNSKLFLCDEDADISKLVDESMMYLEKAGVFQFPSRRWRP